MNNTIQIKASKPIIIGRHLCPRCKSPMTIEEKSSSGCMGYNARVVCSSGCGVVGKLETCCDKSKFLGTPRQRAWKAWKAERKQHLATTIKM